MLASQEITLEVTTQVSDLSPKFLSCSSLRRLARRFFRLPVLNKLTRLVEKLRAVAEPAGRVVFLPQPTREPADIGRFITVLSANLCHDWPRFRRTSDRLEDFARLVEQYKADVILLQEVVRKPGLWVDQWLAHRLGMAYVYSRVNGHASGIGFEEGLAVFSRFPLDSPRLLQLNECLNPFVRRLALGAAVESPLGRLEVVSVHLELLRRSNAVQMNRLHAWVSDAKTEAPLLIGGDFNAHETTSQIRRAQFSWLDTFRCLNPAADGTTHELKGFFGMILRRARLDYIFLKHGLKPWRVLETRHLAVDGKPHSDHRIVMARIAPQGLPG